VCRSSRGFLSPETLTQTFLTHTCLIDIIRTWMMCMNELVGMPPWGTGYGWR
jgi:hypothetical protein